jgi:hypothetical protein
MFLSDAQSHHSTIAWCFFLSLGERIQERGSKKFPYPLSLTLPPRGRGYVAVRL